MNKLLVVCGPTATGKTSLALQLAKKFSGELVSADSRQVYKRMDIGTGKDLPANSKFKKERPLRGQNSKLGENIGFYEIGSVRIWGYDLVEPTQNFSVAQYIKIARKVIKNIWKRNKLPILVGGTGFYIKGVVDGIPTAWVPKNERLRRGLERKTAGELFEKLTELDPERASSMNASDRKNPRRLVRAIEVAQWRAVRGKKRKGAEEFESDTLFIGLQLPKGLLEERIEKRIRKRLKQGLLEEIRTLLSKGLSWDDQSMQALGYKEWKGYIKGNEKKDKVIKRWMINERNYAKRQLTWFKRSKRSLPLRDKQSLPLRDKQSLPLRGKRINWFDVSSKNLTKSVEKLVHKWHNM